LKIWKYVIQHGTSSMCQFPKLPSTCFGNVFLEDAIFNLMVPFGTKKFKEVTLQTVATLSTIIVPLPDVIAHKTKTFPSK
jgi:hypothetical protein